jgi:hypothetical protein
MYKNPRILSLVLCLTFTCFLTQCEACQKKDPATNKPLPDQLIYSISCGFPFPYFDINILTGAEHDFYYTIKSPYKPYISIAVNGVALAGLYLLASLLASKKIVRENRLLIISYAIMLLFNTCLIVPYLPDFIKGIFLYVYVYPTGFIGTLFEWVHVDLPDNNIPPRIYLAVLIVTLYLLSLLIISIIKKIQMTRTGVKGDQHHETA